MKTEDHERGRNEHDLPWPESITALTVKDQTRGSRRAQKRHHWSLLKLLIPLFGQGLRLVGLYRRGVRNALDLQLTLLELAFDDLPTPFDGFTILHLSDPHFDALPGTTAAAVRLVSTIQSDLCVLTGDYRHRTKGPFKQILASMGNLVTAVHARHGIYAILGNHDCYSMAKPIEALGVHVLINETRPIERSGARLYLTGTDDVHEHYTDAARDVLAATPEGFKIALIHSPELADVAASYGYRLYLTGHTHGGQICLPGGRPIYTNLKRHCDYATGLWRHHNMIGYTSTGVGISLLPIRFNCPGEVALITLRKRGLQGN